MKKTKGIVVTVVVLSVLLMVSLTMAAPQDLQPLSSGQLAPVPPSSGQSVYVLFPDIGPAESIRIHIFDVWPPTRVAPLPGDLIDFSCDFFHKGCFEKNTYSNRIDIDGKLLYEGEYGLPPSHMKPNCKPENRTTATFLGGRWTATPGSHTITCILDSKNEIKEGAQNELNNTKSITVNVPLPQTDKIKDIKTKQPIPIRVPGTK